MDSPLLNLKAAAFAMAMAALAATAEAASSYIPTIETADFFLWVAANAIVIAIWLLSSSSRGRTNDDAAAGHDAMDGFYTSSSEYEAFYDAGGGSARRAFDAPASSKRLAREARAAARRADRPRVRKKPAAAAGDDAAASKRAVAAAAAAAREFYHEIRREEAPVATAAAAEPRPGGDEDEDVSMDSLWESIVQRRAARPVAVKKSESWSNHELPRLQRVAETAAAARRGEIRKSASAVSNKAAPAAEAPSQPAAPSAPSAIRNLGWRTRDVLVSISPDELLRRAESFIRRQHEHLRLQRQESEQRQRRLHAGGPALIRV